MIPDGDFANNGILIVTGSTLRAEQADRPLAYQLQDQIRQIGRENKEDYNVLVISDLWYLNAESLKKLPMISIGGPGVNSASAYLLNRIPKILMIENSLVIQIDPYFEDLRTCIWGYTHELTIEALNLFIHKNYLTQFVTAVTARKCS